MTPTSPRRVVLWRHGRTAWNVENRAQGQRDVPMDEVGVAQAADAAPHLAALDPAFVWSSDLTRARDTADALARLTGLPVVTDPRLREYDVGLRAGYTFEEFRAAHPEVHRRFFGDPHFHVPGAEEVGQVARRVGDVIRDATQALPPGRVGVLVGHGAALTSGLLGFFDAPPHLRDMFAGMGNCAWTVLAEHEARGWQIVDYNAGSTAHALRPTDNADAPL